MRGINEIIDSFAERLGQFAVDNMPPQFHRQALQEARLTEYELERLGEEANAEYEDPRYSLYYATLSTLLMKSMLKAADSQRHFPE